MPCVSKPKKRASGCKETKTKNACLNKALCTWRKRSKRKSGGKRKSSKSGAKNCVWSAKSKRCHLSKK